MTLVESRNLLRDITEQHGHLTALLALQNKGFQSPRRKRNSKRKALAGLPTNWREALCQKGLAGKYGVAMLVAALTGCRPAELERGVKVWRTFDVERNQYLVHFEISGAKVKAMQGQPSRHMAYPEQNCHPLVALLKESLTKLDDNKRLIRVEKAVNFTVEVRRIAASLWPKHPHTITPYCFRHQWAADAKRMGTVDSVSQGLGHVSSKTRRIYGTALQCSSSLALRPVIIEAERPIKHPAPRHPTLRPDDDAQLAC
jgi:integrase